MPSSLLVQARRSPLQLILAIVILAFGIASNTAVYEFVLYPLLHPLPYPNSSKLFLWDELSTVGDGVSLDDARYIKDNSSIFKYLAVYRIMPSAIAYEANSRAGTIIEASPDFFPALGIRPIRGSLPSKGRYSQDDSAAVISERFSRELSSSSKDKIVGQQVTVSDRTYTITAVVNPGPLFRHVDLWLPISENAYAHGDGHVWYGIGSLQSAISYRTAQQELGIIMSRLPRDGSPSSGKWTVRIDPANTVVTHEIRLPGALIFLASFALLLLTVASVATISILRLTSAEMDTTIRIWLGAGPYELIKPVVCSTGLQVSFATALGILIIEILHKAAIASIPLEFTQLQQSAPFLYVLPYAVLLAALIWGMILIAPLSILVSVIRRVPHNASLQHQVSLGVRIPMRMGFVILLYAVSTILLITTMLIGHTAEVLTHEELGFIPKHLVAINYGRAQKSVVAQNTYRELQQRLKAVPDVAAIGLASSHPLEGVENHTIGCNPKLSPRCYDFTYVAVAGDYFQAVRPTLIAGRFFNRNDDISRDSVIINKRAAEVLFHSSPSGSLGRTISFGKRNFRIVGVIDNMKRLGIVGYKSDPSLQAYAFSSPVSTIFPLRSMLIRTKGQSSEIAKFIREWLHNGALPNASDFTVTDVIHVVRDVAEPSIRYTRMLFIFSVLAFLIAMLGVYAVTATVVEENMFSNAVRLALGATPHSLALSFSLRTLWIILAGITIGIGGAIISAHFLRSMLYGVTASDPFSFIGGPVVLLVAAIFGFAVPAIRITTINPASLLRDF